MAKRAKQTRLPGMEEDRVQELDDAAEVYYDVMQERLKHTEAESEAKESLIQLMHQHGRKLYKSSHEPPFEVSVTDKSNVRVKPCKPSEGNGDE